MGIGAVDHQYRNGLMGVQLDAFSWARTGGVGATFKFKFINFIRVGV